MEDEIIIIAPKTFTINKNRIIRKNERLELIMVDLDVVGNLRFEVMKRNGSVHSFKYDNVWSALLTGWDVLPAIDKGIDA